MVKLLTYNKPKVMDKKIAENCLKFILNYTKEGSIVWNDQSKYEKGYELYTWRDDEASWSAYLYIYYDYKDTDTYEQIRLHLKVEDQNYTFGKEYRNKLEDLYACMTTLQDCYGTTVDVEYEEVDDGKPFEFKVNINYDFETLGA